MARIVEFRSKTDSWVNEKTIHQNFGQQGILRLDNTSGETKYGFLWFPLPKHFRKHHVISAKVELFEKSDNFTGHTITAKRIKKRFSENTITWDNMPDVDSANSATVAGGGGEDPGDELDITDMLQGVIDGDPWHGIRLAINANGHFDLYSGESTPHTRRPTLIIKMSAKGDAPRDLHPDQKACYGASPKLRWKGGQHPPHQGGDQSASRVQLTSVIGDNKPDWDPPAYDSTMVTNTKNMWDLDGQYAMVDGAAYWWRVRVQDEDGQSTDWSDPAEISYASAGTVQVTSPSFDNAVVQDTTPPILWRWDAGPGGNDQTTAHIQVYKLLSGGEDQKKPLIDTGWMKDGEGWDLDVGVGGGTSQGAWTPEEAKMHVDKGFYRFDVSVEDGKDDYGFARAKNDPDTPRASRIFQLDLDGPVEPPATLTASVIPLVYGVRFEWTRSSTPDLFGIFIDSGLSPDAVVRGDDVFNGGTNYAYTWYGAKPGTTHSIDIRAKTTGVGWSVPSNSVNVRFVPEGIFLILPREGIIVPMAGVNKVDETLSQDGQTFFLLNRRDPVRINGLPRGMYGKVSGTLVATTRIPGVALGDDGHGGPADSGIPTGPGTGDHPQSDMTGSVVKHMHALKEIFGMYSTDPDLRLVWGTHNYPVLVSNLTVSQWPVTSGPPVYDVTFNWWQTGGWDVPSPSDSGDQ